MNTNHVACRLLRIFVYLTLIAGLLMVSVFFTQWMVARQDVHRNGQDVYGIRFYLSNVVVGYGVYYNSSENTADTRMYTIYGNFPFTYNIVEPNGTTIISIRKVNVAYERYNIDILNQGSVYVDGDVDYVFRHRNYYMYTDDTRATLILSAKYILFDSIYVYYNDKNQMVATTGIKYYGVEDFAVTMVPSLPTPEQLIGLATIITYHW